MLGDTPPYVLPPLTFPFRALAALVGRAPLGGEREVALACFLAARLAAGLLPGQRLSAEARRARAAASRLWFGAHTLPAVTRAPLARVTEACTGESAADAGAAVEDVLAVTAAWLDASAREELAQLAAALRREEPPAASPSASTGPSS